MGLPLMRATRAAEPAVEPKLIEPALRNCSALLELLVCTQTTLMPSLANSFSRKPLSLSSIDTGLYVAQATWISLGLSAARSCAAGRSANASAPADSKRREIMVMKTPCVEPRRDGAGEAVDEGGRFCPPSAWRGAGPAL